ncbi:AbrB/MazE/SpoVT family DNA-binding domain-containing protein [Halorhabdus sp. BNX81]|uniref:AbrB/MazE/SpoVT family DNA-binding domain-containing protein n=1 Tax=Halorhabdus sp. BNX81 TaxID=2980181 RepID=UPI0023DD473E|nr:AbrB/MazE/SpoVT family DNA-binding domain-containing protein [Halorhabdus sp. BNX81]WEL22127.1 AbrB family transcriptional regulator [Halorhabdus sp. BNX81]
MSSEQINSESKVSGNQANIPAQIRMELDIDDGDRLRWHLEDDETLRVEVVQQRSGTFSDFDGYEGDQTTTVEREHDSWGVTVE